VRFEQTVLPGVILVEPDVYRDERGFFFECYHRDKYRAGGIDAEFIQDNQSSSAEGVLRGLHLQYRRPQAKLVRTVSGTIFDVVVDVNAASPTFRRFVAFELSAKNCRQVFVPAGYAHGIVALTPWAEVHYKVDSFYDAGGELTVLWNDPDLGIPWPVRNPVLSAKDRDGKRVSEVQHLLQRP
jgi:dTDP-4-dehydrorhamnose 3,5-epimerase